MFKCVGFRLNLWIFFNEIKKVTQLARFLYLVVFHFYSIGEAFLFRERKKINANRKDDDGSVSRTLCESLSLSWMSNKRHLDSIQSFNKRIKERHQRHGSSYGHIPWRSFIQHHSIRTLFFHSLSSSILSFFFFKKSDIPLWIHRAIYSFYCNTTLQKAIFS